MKKIFLLLFFVLFIGIGFYYYNYSLSKGSQISINTGDKIRSFVESVSSGTNLLPQKENLDEHLDYLFPWQKGYSASKEIPIVSTTSTRFRQDEFGLNYDYISGSILKTKNYKTEEGDNGIMYYLQAYERYYTFKDFGIVIGFSKDNFLDKQLYQKKVTKPLFSRYKDADYDVVFQEGSSNYIQRFVKSPTESFTKEFLLKHNMFTGCDFSLESEEDRKYDFSLPKEFIIYTQYPTILDQHFCEQGGNAVVSFVYNPLYPDKYYKVSHIDGCAPSCGVFQYLKFL